MDKASVIRSVLLIVALINQVLVTLGKSPLPIENADLEVTISTVFTVVLSLYTAWKNNYLSSKGKAQKEVLEQNGLK